MDTLTSGWGILESELESGWFPALCLSHLVSWATYRAQKIYKHIRKAQQSQKPAMLPSSRLGLLHGKSADIKQNWQHMAQWRKYSGKWRITIMLGIKVVEKERLQSLICKNLWVTYLEGRRRRLKKRRGGDENRGEKRSKCERKFIYKSRK